MFCPTHLTTGFIFQQILSRVAVTLISGHLGVSKTFSFILFHLLSSYVIKFKINDYKDKEGL